MRSLLRINALDGFTLLELLVVLAIAGLLIAAVPPMISAVLPGTELKSSARELTIALRRARVEAISTGRPIEVTFSAGDPAGYAIAGRSFQSLPQNMQLNVRNLPSSTAKFAGSKAESYRLRFHPDGSSSGATLLLRRGNSSYALTIGWLMGDITLTPDAASVF